VFSASLNSEVRDEDGNETEFIQTLVDQKRIDLDALIDAKSHYLSSPERVKKAIRKLLNQNWRTLSGNCLSGGV